MRACISARGVERGACVRVGGQAAEEHRGAPPAWLCPSRRPVHARGAIMHKPCMHAPASLMASPPFQSSTPARLPRKRTCSHTNITWICTRIGALTYKNVDVHTCPPPHPLRSVPQPGLACTSLSVLGTQTLAWHANVCLSCKRMCSHSNMDTDVYTNMDLHSPPRPAPPRTPPPPPRTPPPCAVYPNLACTSLSVGAAYINSMLGLDLEAQHIATLLTKMQVGGGAVRVRCTFGGTVRCCRVQLVAWIRPWLAGVHACTLERAPGCGAKAKG